MMIDAPTMRQFKGLNATATLYHADCLEIIGELSAIDAVITDPPYGLGADRMEGGTWANMRKGDMDWDVPSDALYQMLSLAPIRIVWGGNYYALPPSRGWLSWLKPDAPPSMAHMELAWTNQDQNARQISWSIAATNAERVGHPTQKPVRVMTWCMEQIKLPLGATVLDPYMGSGTTGIACLRTGRNFIGIEKDAKHFQTACERFEREVDGQLI